MPAAPAAVSRFVVQTRERIRLRGRAALIRALRLTGAAVAAYLVALAIYPGRRPLLAPLTALLVVQVTLFSMLTNGLKRVLSVVAGVMIAVGFSSVVGFSWWSLGLLIAASIVLGQVLRLGPHLLEVPISAMLVLSVADIDRAALGRIVETLIGAGTGVLFNILLPPAVQASDAASRVRDFSRQVGDFLHGVADELAGGAGADDAARWLDEARQLGGYLSRVDSALAHAEESRRLNPRAVGTLDAGPLLRSGLDGLEHSTVALRGTFRAIAERMRADEVARDPNSASDDGAGHGPGLAEEMRQVFAVLLHDLGEAFTTYGELVRAEALGAGDPEEQVRVAAALEALREARVRLTELLLVSPADDRSVWELNGALLAGVDRVLAELDVEERARVRVRLREQVVGRQRMALAVSKFKEAQTQRGARYRLPRR